MDHPSTVDEHFIQLVTMLAMVENIGVNVNGESNHSNWLEFCSNSTAKANSVFRGT